MRALCRPVHWVSLSLSVFGLLSASCGCNKLESEAKSAYGGDVFCGAREGGGCSCGPGVADSSSSSATSYTLTGSVIDLGSKGAYD